MTYAETIMKIKRERLDECPYYEIYDANKNLIKDGRNWESAVKNEIPKLLDETKNYEVQFRHPYSNRYYTEYGLVVIREI